MDLERTIRSSASPALAALGAMVLALGLVSGCKPSTGGGGDGDGASTDSESDEGCIVGAQGCMCTLGGGCDPGLSCVAGLCEVDEGDSSSGSDDTGDETGGCSALGCDCEPGPDACDPGLICVAGSCVTDSCGNGALDNNEACDDGNTVDGDGCDNDCSHTEILDLALGYHHSCALIEGGRLRCWGEGTFGQLGRGDVQSIGDDETPASVGDVLLPEPLVDIDAGAIHSCGRFADEQLRCWGYNGLGNLGYGNLLQIGDDETLQDLGPIDVGGLPQTLAVGAVHACTILGNAKLRCWGYNGYGQLGDGTTFEIPAVVPKLSATPGRTRWIGPSLGEHTRAVLQELLGLADEDLAEMAREQVIAGPFLLPDQGEDDESDAAPDTAGETPPE
ncbi:MAG: hypothetical protein KC457_28600 [Myxococcales bacterium]|nr:hypothetical protein [Myxococcales bacterium]